MAGVLVLGIAPVLGYYGVDVLRNSKAGTQAKTIPEVKFPSTPTAMVAVVDDQQVVTALAVLVLAPGTGKGGTLVSLPTNASRAQTADDKNVPVADSFLTSGADGLLNDVEVLSNVTLNFSAVTTEANVSTLLAPTGQLSVTLPNPVVGPGPGGTSKVLFPAGAATLTPAQAASVLAANDLTKPETGRLANVRAVWNGVASAVGVGIQPAAVSAQPPTSFDDFLLHFFAGPIQVYNDLNTTALTGAANPDKIDVGALDRASVVLVMSGLAPGAMTAPYASLSFRIENGLTDADVAAAGLTGTTSADLSREIVAQLLFLQSNVISVSPEVFTLDTHQVPDKTVVFTATDVQASQSQDFATLFGSVEFQRPTISFPLVDIVIVVGRSYLENVKKNLAIAPATTNPVGTPTTVVGQTAGTVSH
jgi:hypothetical protein